MNTVLLGGIMVSYPWEAVKTGSISGLLGCWDVISSFGLEFSEVSSLWEFIGLRVSTLDRMRWPDHSRRGSNGIQES